MTVHYLDTRFIPDRRSVASRALVAGSLWLRVGLVAACATAIALIMLANGEARPQVALASALAAAFGAAFAWRRAWLLIERADAADAANTAKAPAPTRSAGFGAGVESAASH